MSTGMWPGLNQIQNYLLWLKLINTTACSLPAVAITIPVLQAQLGALPQVVCSGSYTNVFYLLKACKQNI